MKTIKLWKAYNPNGLFGGYSWHTEDVRDGWEQMYSDPYEVEVPDDFYIEKSTSGEILFFKNGCGHGYRLAIGSNCENGNPYLVGGSPVESIKLRVIKKVE